MTATVPSSCCSRSGAGCVCASKATCSCGKTSALKCDCSKAAAENKVEGARCSCRTFFCLLSLLLLRVGEHRMGVLNPAIKDPNPMEQTLSRWKAKTTDIPTQASDPLENARAIEQRLRTKKFPERPAPVVGGLLVRSTLCPLCACYPPPCFQTHLEYRHSFFLSLLRRP